MTVVDELLSAMQDGARRAGADSLPRRTLAVSPVGGAAHLFAGADSDGRYSVAIATAADNRPPAPVRLAEIEVEYGVSYVLDIGASPKEVRATVLRCNSSDPELRRLFAAFAAALLEALSDSPTETEIASQVNKWIGLFWRLQAPARSDVVGLVGELTLIRIAPNARDWVRAWHGDPTSTVDFVRSDPPLEVEVKATSSANRIHSVSSHQAFGDGTRYFASVFVDLRDSGRTLGEFAHEIADGLDDGSDRHRFWEVLVGECGASFAEFMAHRFIWERSTASLALFERDAIPVPELKLPLPAGVSGLKFRSDFTVAPETSRARFFSLG